MTGVVTGVVAKLQTWPDGSRYRPETADLAYVV